MLKFNQFSGLFSKIISNMYLPYLAKFFYSVTKLSDVLLPHICQLLYVVVYTYIFLNIHTGWISDIWKKVQVNILKEPMIVLKQTIPQKKTLNLS